MSLFAVTTRGFAFYHRHLLTPTTTYNHTQFLFL
jgi:hypothetical protein